MTQSPVHCSFCGPEETDYSALAIAEYEALLKRIYRERWVPEDTPTGRWLSTAAREREVLDGSAP